MVRKVEYTNSNYYNSACRRDKLIRVCSKYQRNILVKETTKYTALAQHFNFAEITKGKNSFTLYVSAESLPKKLLKLCIISDSKHKRPLNARFRVKSDSDLNLAKLMVEHSLSYRDNKIEKLWRLSNNI